jgi:hypothetical protein
VLDGVRYVQNNLRASGSGDGGLLKLVWTDEPALPLFC